MIDLVFSAEVGGLAGLDVCLWLVDKVVGLKQLILNSFHGY